MVSNCFSTFCPKPDLTSSRRVPVRTAFTPTCYLCGKKGHYIWRCRSFVGKASKKNPRKRRRTTNGRKSRMLTQRVTSHDLYKEHLGAEKNLTSLFKNKLFSPQVEVSFRDKTVNGLIDSGSVRTIMSRRLFESIENNQSVLKRTKSCLLYTSRCV